jgi:protein-tyrosine phosphatase
MNEGSFRVLHVCVGNVCRSVLAEHLMRDAAERRMAYAPGQLVVASAGTEAEAGTTVHRHIKAILSARGIDTEGFRSTRFTPAAAADADLILTATRAERNQVLAAKPAALRRTFTLTEFARLAPAAAASVGSSTVDSLTERAARLVAAALEFRGYLMPGDPAFDDVTDPVPTLTDFAACATTVASAVDRILDAWLGRDSRTVAAAPSGVWS